MNLHPIDEVVRSAQKLMDQGAEVFQQWLCEWCGMKQTMTQANVFYATGQCEECGQVTDIKGKGCNVMVLFSRPPKPPGKGNGHAA